MSDTRELAGDEDNCPDCADVCHCATECSDCGSPECNGAEGGDCEAPCAECDLSPEDCTCEDD